MKNLVPQGQLFLSNQLLSGLPALTMMPSAPVCVPPASTQELGMLLKKCIYYYYFCTYLHIYCSGWTVYVVIRAVSSSATINKLHLHHEATRWKLHSSDSFSAEPVRCGQARPNAFSASYFLLIIRLEVNHLLEAARWRSGAQQIQFCMFGLQTQPVVSMLWPSACRQASLLLLLFTFIAFLKSSAQEGAFQSGAVKFLTFYHGGASGRA